MVKVKKPKQLCLHVVFDTNVLYTGSASYLLRKEIADLVANQADLPDLRVLWYIPEIVRHERQFQMLEQAVSYLPTIGKLERLLGNPLNIGRDLLELRVKEAVDRQATGLHIIFHPLDHTQVDWPRLMLDAAYRRAPFQPGEKEKGFRDAVILETFMQLIASIPVSPAAARLVLVSGDELLRSAANDRLTEIKNVHVLTSIDELKGLMNTLGSTVDEAFLADVRRRASELFYVPDNKSTVYYKANVGPQLQQALAKAIVLPSKADRHSIDSWTIGHPQFVSKQGQRFSWTTRFTARLKAIKSGGLSSWLGKSSFVFPSALTEHSTVFGSMPSASTHYAFGTQPVEFTGISSKGLSTGSDVSYIAPQYTVTEDQTIATGAGSVDVLWNVSLSTAGNLSNPQVTGVTFVDVVWD